MSVRSAAFILALAPIAIGAQRTDTPPSSPDDIVIADPPIYEPASPSLRTLPSGARLLVLEDHELPLVDGILRFSSGSLHDPEDRVGLTAILVDALREGGSETMGGTLFEAWLDARAATVEITTTPDAIQIEFECIAEDFDEVFAQLFDLLARPVYPRVSVDNARARLLTEIQRRMDDTVALADQVTELLAYGEESPIARIPSRYTVEAIERDDLLEFHRAHLGPGRLLVGVTGDIDETSVEVKLSELLKELPEAKGIQGLPAAAFIQPSQTRIYVVDRPGITQSEIRLAAPGARRSDPDHAALVLWSRAFGIGGMTNRMAAHVRTELGLAYTVGAFFRTEWNRAGRFTAFCGTRNEAVGETLDAMTSVLREGLTELDAETLDAVRRRVESAEIFQVDTARKVLGRAVDLEFNGYPADYWEQHASHIRKAKADEVVQAARRRLNPDRLVVVVVGPADEVIPHLEERGQVLRYDPIGIAVPRVQLPPLVEEMFEAVGGRDLWSRLAAIEADVTLMAKAEIPMRQYLDLGAPRFRVDYQLKGVTQTTVVDGNRGWELTSGGRVEMAPEQVAPLVRSQRQRLWNVLNALARGTGFREVAIDEEGRIRMQVDAELIVHIELDDNRRPRKIRFTDRGVARDLTYSDWSLQGGYSYPSLITEAARSTRWRITRFEPLGAFDPTILEKR